MKYALQLINDVNFMALFKTIIFLQSIQLTNIKK